MRKQIQEEVVLCGDETVIGKMIHYLPLTMLGQQIKFDLSAHLSPLELKYLSECRSFSFPHMMPIAHHSFDHRMVIPS